MKYDIKVVLKQTLPPKTAMAPFKGLDAIKSIEGWVGGVGRIQSDSVATSTGIGLIATPFGSRLKDHDLMQGTWLTGSKELEFVVNQRAALEFKPVVIGRSYPIALNGRRVSAKLVGVVREFDVAKIYLDLDQYNRLVNNGGKINSLMISLNDRSYANVIEVKKAVERIIEKSGMDVIYVMSQAEWAVIIFEHLNIILMAIVFLSLLVLTVSSMGMGSAMGINVIERTREIGVLRAIGATPETIVRLFVVEGFIIVALGVVAGLLMAMPMSALAAEFFGELILGEDTPLDFAFSQLGLVVTLIVTGSFGYIASRAPANKAIKTTVRQAIAYE
jgi:putative ABC transport system permease protein